MIDGRMSYLPLPRILGHEIVGEAPGLGEVIVYASWGDGTCVHCRTGQEQLCAAAAEPGWVRDGGYAEAVLVPSARYLLPLRGLDPLRAAPLADAGITAYRAVRRAQPWLAESGRVIVIGAGGLGQFAIQYLRLFADVELLVVDPAASRRRRAIDLGADVTTASPDALPPARAVFDLVGSSDTLGHAIRLVEPGGIVMLVGEAGGELPFGMSSTPHEAFVTTSVWGSRRDLEDVLDLARRDQIRWTVETMPLEQVHRAVDRLRRGDVAGRLVLTPPHH